MQTAAIIMWVFGALVLLGGILGWVKARSRASLISGLAFGVLVLLCGYAIWLGRRFGLQAGAGISLALAVIMGRRFVATKKFMPAGFLAFLSAVAALALLWTMWG
jgi:uncharacterized membrane protein (UPF0136 family)